MNNIKALFIHDHKFPKQLSKYYKSYGFDQTFIHRYKKLVNDFSILARHKFENEIIADELVGIKEVKSIKSFKELLSREVRLEINDIIFDNDFLIIRLPSILGLYSIFKAKLNKKPYIVELVGCPWDSLTTSKKTNMIFALPLTLLTKLMVYYSTNVIYVTENFLQKRYPTKGVTLACSNVSIIKQSSQVIQDRKKKILNSKLKDDKIIIGTCGTIDAIYKGHENVIIAISDLVKDGYNIEYQMVGAGSIDRLKKISEDYGVSNNIKFLGAFKHDRVFEWIKQIDIYIQPSKTEGLPRSVIEAMSLGCPILGSRAGGIPELLEEEFIFDKNRPDEIAEKIKLLNIDMMLRQSEKNYLESDKYVEQVLTEKRKIFFENFIKRFINDKKNS